MELWIYRHLILLYINAYYSIIYYDDINNINNNNSNEEFGYPMEPQNQICVSLIGWRDSAMFTKQIGYKITIIIMIARRTWSSDQRYTKPTASVM